MDAAAPSPFLLLPAELRLMIYEYLLRPASTNDDSLSARTTAAVDYHDYEVSSTADISTKSTHATLAIRTLDPTKTPLLPSTLRTTYTIRCDRFRARTMRTTYTLLSNPGIDASVVRACRQTHTEAAEVLYGGRTFDFSTHVEAIAPFLGDLTPAARRHVRSLAMVKRGLPYDRECDRLEWAAACRYVAANLAIVRLDLGVVAGKPGAHGWDGIIELRKEAFEVMAELGGEERGWEGMEWVGHLTGIRGLRELGVRAIVEHCPPPVSERMAFWVAFSKSVEGGFGEFVKEVMVGA